MVSVPPVLLRLCRNPPAQLPPVRRPRGGFRLQPLGHALQSRPPVPVAILDRGPDQFLQSPNLPAL